MNEKDIASLQRQALSTYDHAHDQSVVVQALQAAASLEIALQLTQLNEKLERIAKQLEDGTIGIVDVNA